MYTEFHDMHCQETEDPALSPMLRGFYAKLKGYCARLALIHAICTNPNAVEIGLVDRPAAIKGLISRRTRQGLHLS